MVRNKKKKGEFVRNLKRNYRNGREPIQQVRELDRFAWEEDLETGFDEQDTDAFSRLKIDVTLESKNIITLQERVTVLNTIFLLLNPHFDFDAKSIFFESASGESVSIIVKHRLRDHSPLQRFLKPSKTLNQTISKKAGFKCLLRSGIESVERKKIDVMTWRRYLSVLKAHLQRRKQVHKVKVAFQATLSERITPGLSHLLKKLSRAEEIIISDSSFSLLARNDQGYLIEVGFSQTKKSNVLHTKQMHLYEFWLTYLPKWYSSLRRANKLSSSLFNLILEYTGNFNAQLSKKVIKELQVCSMALTRPSSRRLRKKEPRQTWAFKIDKPNILNRLCGLKVKNGEQLEPEEISKFFFLMQQAGSEICSKIEVIGN